MRAHTSSIMAWLTYHTAAQLGPVYAMDTSGWVQIIAVHLASEPKFIAFMGNPQPLEFVLVDQEWLVAIYLPGRTKKYDDSAVSAWFARGVQSSSDDLHMRKVGGGIASADQ